MGTTEAFVVETLSTGGLSLMRPARQLESLEKKGLDERFVWLTVPLPDSSEKVTALIEVLHRERFGLTERVRARFEHMSFPDRVKLADHLAAQDLDS